MSRREPQSTSWCCKTSHPSPSICPSSAHKVCSSPSISILITQSPDNFCPLPPPRNLPSTSFLTSVLCSSSYSSATTLPTCLQYHFITKLSHPFSPSTSQLLHQAGGACCSKTLLLIRCSGAGEQGEEEQMSYFWRQDGMEPLWTSEPFSDLCFPLPFCQSSQDPEGSGKCSIETWWEWRKRTSSLRRRGYWIKERKEEEQVEEKVTIITVYMRDWDGEF